MLILINHSSIIFYQIWHCLFLLKPILDILIKAQVVITTEDGKTLPTAGNQTYIGLGYVKQS